MAKNQIFRKKANIKTNSSNKYQDELIREWMSGDDSSNQDNKDKKSSDSFEEIHIKSVPVEEKKSRIDTGILKMRIEDKIKKYTE